MMLSPEQKDAVIYNMLLWAAVEGAYCPTADQLAEAIGEEDGGAISTTVMVMRRLEKQGKITVERYQKGRVVTIVESGKRTAEPKCKVPHWRDLRACSQSSEGKAA